MSVAQADDECRAVVADGIVYGSKEQIAQHGDEHAVRGILRHMALPQRACPDKTAHDEPRTEQGEEESCAGGNAELLLAVDGQVGADDAIREAIACHGHALAPSLEQQEAVQREGLLVADCLARPQLERGVDEQSDASRHHGQEE